MQKTILKTQTITPTQHDDVIIALADIVQNTHTVLENLEFKAQLPNTSLFDAPTFAVDTFQNDRKICSYKFNVLEDNCFAPNTLSLLLSPLVIQWADDGKHKKPGIDKKLIHHCISVIQSFLNKNGRKYNKALLTTAYLTKQRAGKVFFTQLGWKLIEFEKSGPAELLQPMGILTKVSERIEKLSAAHRVSPEEENHICFAYTVLKNKP